MGKDWAPLQEEIRKLYHVENQPLREVMRLIKGRHGFHASERSYRTRLQKWGYLKYGTESHPKPISRTQHVRPRRHSNAAHANFPPPVSSLGGISRAAPFQPNISSFPMFDNSPTNGLYYGTGPATAIQHSNGEYLDINHSMPTGTSQTPLHYGFGMNEQDGDGKSQLHRATIDKSLDQVKALVFAGAAVDVKDHSGYEPLHYAVIANHLEIFKLLLQFGADVNAKCRLGRTPIHYAVSNKQMVDLLLRHGADVSSQDDRGDTALHLALTNPSLSSETNSAIDTLLSSTRDPNLANHAGFTPFHRLLDREYDYVELDYLARTLDLGADISHTLPDGRLPAQVFLARSHHPWRSLWGRRSRKYNSLNRVLKTLLAKGADPLTPLPNGYPLFIHIVRNELFSLSMNHTFFNDLCKSVKTGPITEEGNSALHELSLQCSNKYYPSIEEQVGTILSRGADPNLRNQQGQTPLLLLFNEEHNSRSIILKVMEKMLAFGADPMLQDQSGKCPLHVAAEQLSMEELKPLLRAAAEHKGPWPPQPDLPLDGQSWWENWNRALQTVHWIDAKNLLTVHKGPFSQVQLSAYWTLAEKHLEKAKNLSEGDADELKIRRSCVAGILQDCRMLNILIDLKYVDYLLELCH